MKQQAEALAPRPIYKVAVSRVRAAELLDVSTGTFDDWVRRGLMPRGVKIGPCSAGMPRKSARPGTT